MKVTFFGLGRLFLTWKLSHHIAHFEVVVLCRDWIYMTTFVRLGFVSETQEQTDEQV